ncbi:MAG: hypothetical protein EOM67_12025, partial [Spirochaetia bacterium]|nr:hypothetical protein [Spirochaetia bacterium]
MKKTSRFSIIAILFLVTIASPLSASVTTGGTTLGGLSGYVVTPSAIPVPTGNNPAITTGYTAMFGASNGFSHIPFIQMGFAKNFEAAVAVDISLKTSLLVQAKWRFIEKNSTNFAFIINGQAIDLSGTYSFAGQTGFA